MNKLVESQRLVCIHVVPLSQSALPAMGILCQQGQKQVLASHVGISPHRGVIPCRCTYVYSALYTCGILSCSLPVCYMCPSILLVSSGKVEDLSSCEANTPEHIRSHSIKETGMEFCMASCT